MDSNANLNADPHMMPTMMHFPPFSAHHLPGGPLDINFDPAYVADMLNSEPSTPLPSGGGEAGTPPASGAGTKKRSRPTNPNAKPRVRNKKPTAAAIAAAAAAAGAGAGGEGGAGAGGEQGVKKEEGDQASTNTKPKPKKKTVTKAAAKMEGDGDVNETPSQTSEDPQAQAQTQTQTQAAPKKKKKKKVVPPPSEGDTPMTSAITDTDVLAAIANVVSEPIPDIVAILDGSTGSVAGGSGAGVEAAPELGGATQPKPGAGISLAKIPGETKRARQRRLAAERAALAAGATVGQDADKVESGIHTPVAGVGGESSSLPASNSTSGAVPIPGTSAGPVPAAATVDARPTKKDARDRTRSNRFSRNAMIPTVRDLMWAYGDEKPVATDSASVMTDIMLEFISDLCVPLPPSLTTGGGTGAGGGGGNAMDDVGGGGGGSSATRSGPRLTLSLLRRRLSAPIHAKKLARLQEMPARLRRGNALQKTGRALNKVADGVGG